MRGLTGTQGVLIPVENVEDLMLRDDVIEAVAAGKFHVHPVARIEEGIEILTGVAAGQPTLADISARYRLRSRGPAPARDGRHPQAIRVARALPCPALNAGPDGESLARKRALSSERRPTSIEPSRGKSFPAARLTIALGRDSAARTSRL